MLSRREKKDKKKNSWFKIIFILLITFAASTSLGFLAAQYAYSNIKPKTDKAESAQTQPTPKVDDRRINVLLLGVDDGDPDMPDSPRRSDTMMVASVNAKDGKISLLSIPRDTRVKIPGHSGYDKITHAYFYGGPQLAAQTVEQFLDIEIDHYVTINWKAFIKIIDLLGGVDINVAHDMNYEDPYEGLAIHLKKGQQHLDGEKAGQYVRFRHDELGDIGRVQRQQEFLRALSDQMLQAGTIIKLPSLIAVMKQYIQTDMDTITLVKMANSLTALKSGGLQSETLPGDFATIDGVSYWQPSETQLQAVVDKLFR